MDWKTFSNLIDILIWPVLVLVVLLAYYDPLTAFITSLGRRLTKLSIYNFSIELAALPSALVPWSDPSLPQSAELISGDFFSTSVSELLKLAVLRDPSKPREMEITWDYLLIDIKDGQFWFISRLFIFTVFLQSMRGVKSIVFVESENGYRRRLIGLASPETVIIALAKSYPWLERALSNAMIEHKIVHLNPSLDPLVAGNIIQSFVDDPEMRSNVLPDKSEEYVEVHAPNQSFWEHTNWLTLEKLGKDLRQSFYEWDSSHYVDMLDIPRDKRGRELLNRTAPFIALVNSKGEFKELLDRQKLLEQVVRSLQSE